MMNKEELQEIYNIIEQERSDWIEQTEQLNDVCNNIKNTIRDYFEVEQ